MVPDSWLPVVAEARPLAERFAAAGHRLYLVGGVVRDLVAGRSVSAADLDFTTDARPDAIKAVLAPWAHALWTQGERFGTIGATHDGRSIEITTHRAEAYVADSRKPVVAFSTDVVADLSRRDFTINAMALEVTGPEPELIDPFGGHDDLVGKLLRTPLTPEVSFDDDPLRMLRAARFVAAFELEPAVELVAAATARADRLTIVSAERVRDELHKLLLVDDPTTGVEHLERTGLLGLVLPEVAALTPAERARHVAAVAGVPRRGLPTDVEPRLAALLSGCEPSVVRSRLRELRHANRTTAAVLRLVSVTAAVLAVERWTDADVRRVCRDAGTDLDRVLDVAGALSRAGAVGAAELAGDHLATFERRRAALAAAGELDDLGPPLDGEEVVAHLGLEPGPVVGEALAHLLDLRLRSGRLDRSSALAALDAWWAARPPEIGGGTP